HLQAPPLKRLLNEFSHFKALASNSVIPAGSAGIQVDTDVSESILANLIIMKAMQTVTAVLGRTDRGGDTLWKTLHWMFTSITPGHESRTEKGNSCMGVGWPIVVGTSRTSLSDGLPARP